MLPPREDWVPLAEQASKEMDPEKLMSLVKQLCSVLDDRKKPALPPEQQRGNELPLASVRPNKIQRPGKRVSGG